MGFFNNIQTENLAARVTNKGRQKIAEGNFVIAYFQIGDSEFDYAFPEFDGTDPIYNPPQKIFIPLDKDATVKYPYKLSESTVTGTTFGTPIQSAETTILTNNMGAAGFVSEYVSSGSSVGCDYAEIDIDTITGTTTLYVPTGFTFTGCEYITLAFSELSGTDPDAPLITSESNSLIYKIVTGITGDSYNTLTLDRNTPDLSGFTGYATVICNKCNPFFPGTYVVDPDCLPASQNPEDRQDPWTLNIVWSQKPAGLDVPDITDESLYGYVSNVFVSTKEYLGYNSISGQTGNTGTTIVNSMGDAVIVPPTEQHSLAIIHYAEVNSVREPEKYFKYEDYIAHTETDDIEYFEIYIPFLLYHRNTGTTVGARFFMDTVDHYINPIARDTKIEKIKYRYLKDEQGYRVGKVFVHHKIIIFDDQEIVAALDYKSNRKYTLPIPRAIQIPTDVRCEANNIVTTEPLMSGATNDVYISYLFEMTGNTGMTGLHCNHYVKVTGTSLNADVSINFSTTDFKYMTNNYPSYVTGYIADKFYILAQKVLAGQQPIPQNWKLIDFTEHIPNHNLGDYINPDNMKGSRFILTQDDYENQSTPYDLENFLGELPDELLNLQPYVDPYIPEFGDTQPFPGSVKLVRAIDIHTMRYLINLPSSQFETTQNPTYVSGVTENKVVTEVALLDDNKDVLVIAKTPKPFVRTGSQVLGIKIDF